MRLADAAVRAFARHETFHPRYGWFRKAYAFVRADPRVFLRKDATVRIGVGKNMVRAIRFWGMAAKLIEEDENSPNRRSRDLITTSFGNSLFDEDGWDPYMEDPGTLWLLHWKLLAPRSLLPIWWLAFNEFHAVEFTERDLEEAVTVQLESVAEWTVPHASSVKKDVGALLRTYAPSDRSRRILIDDKLDCPLRELNLVGRSAATGHYRFTLGAKSTLPSEILAYTALDYLSRTTQSGNSVTLSRLAREVGAPGRIFKLSESDILAALEPVVHGTAGLAFVAANAVTQLAWSQDPGVVAVRVLDRYYGRSASTDGVGPVEMSPSVSAAAGGR